MREIAGIQAGKGFAVAGFRSDPGPRINPAAGPLFRASPGITFLAGSPKGPGLFSDAPPS